MTNLVPVMDNKAAITQGLDELTRRFIASLDVKPKSKDTYSKALKRFFSFMEEEQITNPTREDILHYKRYLAANYTACTVSSYLTAVKAFFTYLEGLKQYPNVAAGIKGAKHQKGFRKASLTIEQAKNTLTAIDRSTLEGKRNFALVNLLLRTGLRTIEVARANIEDIRQEGGEALLYIQGKGRDSKDDFVLLTEETLRPIREYLKERGETDETKPLFASHSNRNNGGRLTTRSISRITKETLKDAGIDDRKITAHSLRHTAVTFSLLGGATIQEAQGLARHANINTTLIYAHNIDRIGKAPERKIDALLAGL